MIRTLSSIILALCVCAAAYAQEIRKVDGEKYIVHTVEKGQTLFGISKHYAVPLKDVAKANPGAELGLSIGQVLLVPTRKQSRRELRAAPKLGEGELLHTVAKRETLYGISRQYGVTQEDLRRWNPDLAYGLRTGMVLHIQVAKSTAAPPVAIQPAVADNAEFHHVAAGETLYALSKRYGLSGEAIKAANGGLPEGLKAGTYVRIPRTDTTATVDSTAAVDTVARPPVSVYREIAVLLPFTDLANDSTVEAQGGPSPITEAAIEFRAGLGLALDTLRKMGLNADVHVFDTGVEPAQWNPLFRSDDVRGMDLYVGPFHRSAVEAMVRAAGGAPVICPVQQSNKVLLGNPTVSKAVGSRTDRIKLMARYIAVKHARDNVLLVKPDIYSERALAQLMEDELKALLPPVAGMPGDSLQVVACERRNVENVLKQLDPTRRNIVVVPSEDVELVTTVVNKLSAKADKTPITVYGLNTWMDMPSLDISALVKLNVHLPANSFIDRSNSAVNDFVAKYRAKYNNEPGEYAFLGYDVALYYISALMQFGDHFPVHYALVQASPLHMGFRMVKLGPENGWSNGSAVMLQYLPEGIRKEE